MESSVGTTISSNEICLKLYAFFKLFQDTKQVLLKSTT